MVAFARLEIKIDQPTRRWTDRIGQPRRFGRPERSDPSDPADPSDPVGAIRPARAIRSERVGRPGAIRAEAVNFWTRGEAKSSQLQLAHQSRQLQLARLMRSQSGVIGLPQLRALGVTKAELTGMVSRRELWRLHRGVYADARSPMTPRSRPSAKGSRNGFTALSSAISSEL